MTTRADFTSEEWELLLKPLFAVGPAVAEVADSGSVGTVMEYGAILIGAMEARKQYASNKLLAALLTDAQTRGLGKQPGRQKDAPASILQKDDLLAACRSAVALLSRKASSQEAAEYRYTVLLIGSHVANAAKEGGGVLGAGGQRVSASESAILKEISGALGIS